MSLHLFFLLEKYIWCFPPILRSLSNHVRLVPASFFFFFFFFGLFRAAPVAYGGSQARGWIGAKLPAYTTATAMPDPSCNFDLCHSSQQCLILNPLREARDGTFVLMDTSQVHYHWATMGTPIICVFKAPFLTLPSSIYILCLHRHSLVHAFIHVTNT